VRSPPGVCLASAGAPRIISAGEWGASTRLQVRQGEQPRPRSAAVALHPSDTAPAVIAPVEPAPRWEERFVCAASSAMPFVPRVAEHLQPIVSAVPLQLLAYHIALVRGCDVDRPRNLAKSVTVE
jgi:hypothetical protein